MVTSAEEEKKCEIINRLLEEINKKASPKFAPHIIQLVKQLFCTTSAEDLEDHNLVDLYGFSLSFWSFIEKRLPKENKVRVFNPHHEQQGWQSTHTIVEMILDDAPFLIDSITMALNRLGLTIHFIAYQGIQVNRSAVGEIESILASDAPKDANAINELPIYLEIDRQNDQATLHKIKEFLESYIEDVTYAVTDWQAMLKNARLAKEQLVQGMALCDPIDFSEKNEFLQWVIGNHYTFLGFREFAFDKKHKVLKMVPNSSLGLLKGGQIAKKIPEEFDSDSIEINRLLSNENLITITKIDVQSTVHRPAYLDLIGIKKFNDKKELIGEYWLLGLYTASAYNASPSDIPLLRRKVAKVIERTGIQPSSHAGKTILNILETLPRDDLFQADIDALLNLTMGIYQIHERQRICMFTLPNTNRHFISCLVFIPRERFSTQLRESMQSIMSKAFRSKDVLFSTRFSDSVLARMHFVFKIDPNEKAQYDLKDIEAKLVQIGRSWQDELQSYLVEHYGEEKGNQLFQQYALSFPSSYREAFGARTAVYDIRHIESIFQGAPLEMNFYRPLDDLNNGALRLKVYKLEGNLSLSNVLPILENMGLRVISERPYEIIFQDGKSAWMNDFALDYDHEGEVDLDDIRDIFQATFQDVWFARCENDAFNKLVLSVGLNSKEITILRAYAKYLKQTGFTFSQAYIEQTLVDNPDVAKNLVKLFHLRFDPKLVATVQNEVEQLEAEILASLEQVSSLDEDRILRRYLDVIKVTVRTNYFQKLSDGQSKPYLSLKLNPHTLIDIPSPKPKREFFVYSPRFEAVHLTFENLVARGGIRWSDRKEDFRTEILGLMKTQEVKNAQIVPGGAKGGFILKSLATDATREVMMAEGIACYQNFMRGMLDITDNLKNGKIVAPAETVRYDTDDPYLVVAADKGTANFSDIANEISLQYGHWLGDAFASGGSAGYDHKKIAITARGAWESVKRHFRLLGIDIQKNDFTAIGIGDMAGDVFGNGVLLSKRYKLIGAFNHEHIFIDPNPDPEKSFAERQRLFNLPRSSWSDYNPDLISKGGGVFKRSEKSIKVSPEMKQALQIEDDQIIPNDLIRAILKAPVDLLWNGGIGTFVKSTEERHIDVGDRTNDAIRINGVELRCKVVGEGGNLGFTQLARKEYAMNGGMIYTDFIDNSGGVDCSDHEVNIKILLDSIAANGDLTQKQRNELLASMTDEVAQLVLKDNYDQTQAISITANYAEYHIDMHSRYIDYLEQIGKIDRSLEHLPDKKTLMEHKRLTTPDIAVLLSLAKSLVKQDILKSDVPEESAFADMIELEFPSVLRQRYRQQMNQHRLKREIIATQLVNQMINEMGFTFVYRLHDETGAPTAAIVRAYTVARSIFDIPHIWKEVEALDNKVSAHIQMDMMLELIRLVRRGTRWFLRNRRMKLDVDASIKLFKAGVAKLYKDLPRLLGGHELERYHRILKHFQELGVPNELAARIASVRTLFSSLDIVEAATMYGFDISDVASLYYQLGERLEISWVRNQVIERVVENHWESLSREALRDDLNWQQRQLAISILAQPEVANKSKEEKYKFWLNKYHILIERWRYMISELRASSTSLNFIMFFVATRELLDLTQTCFQAVDVCAIDNNKDVVNG